MLSDSKKLIPVVTVASAVLLAHYVILTSIWKRASKAAPNKGGGPTTIICKDRAMVSKELCDFVATAANEAIAARGVFYLSVAGGSLLDSLAGLSDYKNSVNFSKVVLSFADHKCVKPDNEKATMAKSKEKFASAAGITTFVSPCLLPVDGGDGTTEAQFYAKALKDAGIPHTNRSAIMDLILLGLGADGHVGSCHPMGPAVATIDRSVTASPKSGEPASITFTIETINSARQVAVVVCGGAKGKKEAVKRAIIRPAESARGTFPAQLLESPVFFLDAEAADAL